MGTGAGLKPVLEQYESQRIHMFKRGIITGVPIMLGYIPVALTYGVLARQAGLSIWELTLMSILVFAGASQFMGANMIALGAGVVEIVIATFVLNFRHFVMSLSFMNQLRGVAFKFKLPLASGLTDETFAVSSIHSGEAKQKNGAYYYVGITIVAYLSWVIGSLLGGVLGEVIPERLSQSMGIALYAMFIGLLIPSVKKNVKVALIAVVAMLINFLCVQIGLSSGWAIVVGTILGGFGGVYLLKENEK
ncbi:AzlC family ABC transporter permease [Oceanobacillus senegalensis]|uniref:AzlC family ABC transporter permease n=1 Tax=Oceanobacillus senegalensis TaxID=1936063 RepID=UPI000A30FEE1|nr:AzlC family ABC transporter permease [Oceanobacillus senegalensis]